MKVRVLLVLLCIIALVGGGIWWLLSPPPLDEAKPPAATTASSSPAAAPKPVASTADSTPKQPAQEEPTGLGRQMADNAAPSSTEATTSSPSNSAEAEANQEQTNVAAVPKGFQFPAPAAETTAFATLMLEKVVGPRRRLPADSLSLDSPLAVYDLTSIAAKGEGLNDAVFSGAYLYPVDSGGQTVDGIGVRADGPSLYEPRANYAQISAGLQYLAGLEQVQAGSYEVRFVSVGSISSAIWLKSENGGDDLFYTVDTSPFPDSRAPIQAGNVMSAADYLTTVSQLEQKSLGAQNSPFYTNRGRGGQ